jgi:hypothetical protein
VRSNHPPTRFSEGIPINIDAPWEIPVELNLTAESHGQQGEAVSSKDEDNWSKFDLLLDELMRKKEGLSKDRILALIQEKKDKVGSGYLTDQGALFLVAAELGAPIGFNSESRSRIVDLLPDQKEATIIGRLVSVALPKKFQRKSDSSNGILLKLAIYDESGIVVVNLWSARSIRNFFESRFALGDLVKVAGAYVRKNTDGSSSLNLSEGATIEQAREGPHPNISPLDQNTSYPAKPPSATNLLILRGRVVGKVKRNDFVRKDSSPSFLVSFWLSDGIVARIVLWENSNPVFQSLNEGESVTITNLKPKISRSEGHEETEFHGDDSSCVLERWNETWSWLKKQFEDLSRDLGIDTTTSKRQNQILPFVGRILSIGQLTSKEKSAQHLLLSDSSGRRISLTALDDSAEDIKSFETDNVVICRPDSVDPNGFKATCSKKGALVKCKSERRDIPSARSLVNRIESLEKDTIVSLEAISLAEPAIRNIQTKEGPVKRAEVSIADATGEIRLYAWRNLSNLLEKIRAGTRIWLHAVEVQSHEERKFLVMKNYSRIEFLE